VDELANAKRIMAQIIQDVSVGGIEPDKATEEANRMLDRMWACGLESALDPGDRPRE
jgi:hypothetical protein